MGHALLLPRLDSFLLWVEGLSTQELSRCSLKNFYLRRREMQHLLLEEKVESRVGLLW